MTFLADPEFWARLVTIVLIDLSLAGDNALVIALAVRSLSAREQWLGRVWGTAAAVALRLLFIAIVSALLTIPLLRFAGGLLLLWIAVRLVRPGGTEEGEVRHGASLRQAVWIIVVADVTMSLDNVLAVAAAAHGDFVLVTIGIALSLPIVVWGSGFLARLMAHHAWIIWIGGGVLGYVAGEMMTDDPLVRAWLGDHADTIDDPLSLLLAVGLALLGWWLARSAASGPTAREGA
ncbi:MAG TPA: TerC family protein [Methylomirabilota bacterium]|nr:TerC family protein [Methylomirabilota bacterium]